MILRNNSQSIIYLYSYNKEETFVFLYFCMFVLNRLKNYWTVSKFLLPLLRVTLPNPYRLYFIPKNR